MIEQEEREREQQEPQQQKPKGTTTATAAPAKPPGRSWWQFWRKPAAAPPKKSDAAQRAAEATLKNPGPLDILRRGAAGPLYGKAAQLPNELLLTESSVLEFLGISPAAAAADRSRAPGPAAPRPLSPLLPDLHNGNGGLTLTHTATGAARCALMAAVMNRLAANALDGLPGVEELAARGVGASEGGQGGGDGGGGVQQERFVVRLREGWPEIDSVEDLLEGLGELWLAGCCIITSPECMCTGGGHCMWATRGEGGSPTPLTMLRQSTSHPLSHQTHTPPPPRQPTPATPLSWSSPPTSPALAAA